MSFRPGPYLSGALGALVLSLALRVPAGLTPALAVLGAAGALAMAVGILRGAPREPEAPALSVLGAASAAGLAVQLFSNPTQYGDARALSGGFQWLAVTALVLLSAYLCIHLRASLVKARFLLLLACFLVMGIAVLRASPGSDARFASLGLMVAAAWMLGRAGGVRGELAAIFAVYQPRTFAVLEQGSIEPLLLACAAAVALGLSRWARPLMVARASAASAVVAAGLALLLLNQQASSHYDWLAAGLLCAVAALRARAEG